MLAELCGMGAETEEASLSGSLLRETAGNQSYLLRTETVTVSLDKVLLSAAFKDGLAQMSP